jgi:hypothetical protein
MIIRKLTVLVGSLADQETLSLPESLPERGT